MGKKTSKEVGIAIHRRSNENQKVGREKAWEGIGSQKKGSRVTRPFF